MRINFRKLACLSILRLIDALNFKFCGYKFSPQKSIKIRVLPLPMKKVIYDRSSYAFIIAWFFCICRVAAQVCGWWFETRETRWTRELRWRHYLFQVNIILICAIVHYNIYTCKLSVNKPPEWLFVSNRVSEVERNRERFLERAWKLISPSQSCITALLVGLFESGDLTASFDA